MATQFAHLTPTVSFPAQQAKVTYLPGVATAALSAAIAAQPQNADRTLDELIGASPYAGVLPVAQRELSLPMFAAFERWLAKAVQFQSYDGDDKGADAVCHAHADALKAVFGTPAELPADHDLKAYLLMIEVLDGPIIGPLDQPEFDPQEPWVLNNGIAQVVPELLARSAVARALTDASKGRAVDALDNQLGRKADTVIGLARDVLSPDVFKAFVQWMETAARFETYASDDEADDEELCEAKSDAHTQAFDGLLEAPAWNVHDLALKTWFLATQHADSPSFGPMPDQPPADHVSIDRAAWSVHGDLATFSPLPTFLDDLARAAWKASDKKTYLTPNAGQPLIEAFERAGRSTETAAIDPAIASFAGYRTALSALADHAVTLTLEQEVTLQETMDLHWDELLVPANSIEGVIRKMQVAWQQGVEDAWGQYAVLDPSNEQFRDELGKADISPRMGWSAIEDLARMSGIDLNNRVSA